ncbi:HTH-type transcriptional regulator CdhR [bacterium YEK0313]|nr:HTH-type transcriptional regulator CdhR [bacterium YEK0313]
MTGRLRLVLWGGLGAAALLLAAGIVWLWSLPAAPGSAIAPPVGAEEQAATLAALKPPKRARPLITIVGINDATETTDYLMPYGILRRADVADVSLLATAAGPVKLYPALTVEPDATIADFDRRHPDGADYVVVPAMSRDDDPAVLQWLRSQADKGAIILGICVGAKVVAAAGLLDGRRGTTHWYSVGELRQRHPAMRYVADRRLVVDGKVATTTGITASMPMMLTLIEAIAGRDRAEATARDLGLAAWDARHASGAFVFTRPFAVTAIANTLAFWRWERLRLDLAPGMDEVTLALVADAWSRTYRSRAVTAGPAAGPVATRSGARLVPDQVAAERDGTPDVSDLVRHAPATALDLTLAAIEARYGASTASFVATQLEYPSRPAAP